MKIISVYNNKGGVGKTTTTKMLAKFLESKGKQVLIIDMDPQANISSQFVNQTNASIYDVLFNNSDITENILVLLDSAGISILPGNIRMLKANNEMLMSAMSINPATRLKEKISCLNEYLFDYILIDCPPTMDLLVTNALAVSDEVIIPLKADNYSIQGISMLLEKIEEIKQGYNNSLKISSLFLNEYQNTKINKQLFNELCDIPFFNQNVINKYTIIQQDTFENNVSKKQMQKHPVTKQYEKLFNSLLEV